MYYVYILKSEKDNSLYKGVTQDLKKRIDEHNNGSVKSTKAKRPYALAWYCAFPERQKALDFEGYLKHGSGLAFAEKHFL